MSNIVTIFYIIAGIALILLLNAFIVLYQLKKQEKQLILMRIQLESDNHKTMTEYSEKVLEFIRILTTQVAVLEFRTFVDTHKMDKINRSIVTDLVNKIAKEVHKAINTNNIDFEDTLFTKEFFETYIIETSSITVKNLLNKAVNEE